MKPDHEVTGRRALTEHHTEAGGSGISLDLRNCTYPFVDFFHNLVGLSDVGSRRSTYVDVDRTHVLLRHETGLGCAHEVVKTSAGDYKQDGGEPSALEYEKDQVLVFIYNRMESGVERVVEPCRETCLFSRFDCFVRRHDKGAQGRGESERVQQ